jgi:ABC-type phosphate transport system substrate-binding protein
MPGRSGHVSFFSKESSQVMFTFALSSRRRRIALSVGGAVAAALVAAPVSSAQFTLAECQGSLAPGTGATFQNSAFTGFQAAFGLEAPVGCGAAAKANVSWTPSGSGAGRAALGDHGSGNTTGERLPGYRWAGADEPPNPTQRAFMEAGPVDANGADVTHADDNKLHVIPVAIGAIAVIVNLPAQCDSYGTATLHEGRPAIKLADLEKVWYGDAQTWGDLIPNIDPDCANVQVKRVVRSDGSGSSFAFKQAMARINPAHTLWGSLDNQQWPLPTGPYAPTKPRDGDGGGNLAKEVNLNDGSIGYVDLATARGNGNFNFDTTTFDDKFWVPLQRAKDNDTIFVDPQADTNGYKNGATARGANCAGVVPRNVPAGADPTLGNWAITDSTINNVAYPICTLTYDMAFDDNAVVYCKSAEEEAKARTVKDYLLKGVLSPAGQASLPKNDYDALPQNVLDISLAGARAIDWNKGGAGRPCPGGGDEQPPAATPTPTPPAGGGPTPPPAAPSNKFTISSARAVGTSIRLSIQLPGAGKLAVASSAKPKKGKAIKLASKNVTASKSGAQTVTVALSAKAKSALKKDKKLKFTVKVTFTPTGGTANSVSKSVTVKQAKKKKSKS